MKLSEYFLPVLKEVPSEATIVSHRLMLRSGMIKQAAAGCFAQSPSRNVRTRNTANLLHPFSFIE